MTSSVSRYAPSSRFHDALKVRVDAYFSSEGLHRRGNFGFFLKCAAILGWSLVSYVVLVFFAESPVTAIVAALSLALGIGGIGFNIAHDANHQASSGRRDVNRALSMTFDLVGVSSFLWRWKHNSLHHAHTNVTGMDLDLDSEPMLRLSPHQRYLPFHRYQFIYAWGLYSLLVMQWHFWTDFSVWFRGGRRDRNFPTPRASDHVVFWLGKLIFFGWAFVLPAFFHSFGKVLFFYGFVSALIGFLISVVFQLAHCRADAVFPAFEANADRVPVEWAQHQVEATVDFCRENRWLGWYLGGLGFQIEHHLFPAINHVHYRDLSAIVESTSREFGIRYAADPSLAAALGSHLRWLMRMGKPGADRVPLSVVRS